MGGGCLPTNTQALASYCDKVGVNACIPNATHAYNEFHHELVAVCVCVCVCVYVYIICMYIYIYYMYIYTWWASTRLRAGKEEEEYVFAT